METTEQQINPRCQFRTGIKRETVATLQTMFDQHNQLIRSFRIALERMPTDDYRVVIRADKTPKPQTQEKSF